jgi:hypothetical protein
MNLSFGAGSTVGQELDLFEAQPAANNEKNAKSVKRKTRKVEAAQAEIGNHASKFNCS